MQQFFQNTALAFKRAMRTVWHEKRQYLCFFIAILCLQSVLWASILAMHIRKTHAYSLIKDNFNYHLTVSHLDEYNYNTLYNLLHFGEETNDKNFQSYTFFVESDGTHSCRVILRAPLHRSFANFEYNYLRNLNGIQITESPLYTFRADYLPGIVWQTIGLVVSITVFSTLILMWLYRIRLRHFSFLYSIYMTCGADFLRLFSAGVFELMCVALMTLIPSAAIGITLVLVIYKMLGVSLSFSLWSVFLVPLLTVLIVCAATYFPMKKLSEEQPVDLLKSADNAGSAKSPRFSKNIFGKRFPFAYEWLSMRRYFKYYIILISGAVIFSTAFLCGMFIARMQETKAQSLTSEMTLTMPNMKVGVKSMREAKAQTYMDAVDELVIDLDELSKTGAIRWSASSYATEVLTHLNIDSKHVLYGSELVVPSYENNGYNVALNRFQFKGASKTWLDFLVKEYGDRIEGDVYAVLTEPNAIILSESIAGSQAFSFKPGQKVMMASPTYNEKGKIVLKEGAPAATTMFYSEREMLNQQIDRYEFTYRELTVVAVIHDDDTGNYLSAIVSQADYPMYTQKWAIADTIEVYPTSDATLKDIETMHSELTYLMSVYNGWTMTENRATLKRLISGNGGMTYLIQIISWALLSFSPLVWFFSQTLFYRRRYGEWNMLEALGATKKRILVAHLFNGFITALVSVALTLGFGYAFNGILFWMCTKVLPAWNFIERVPYKFDLPLSQVLLCVGVSALCGFLSTFLPYIFYRKSTAGYKIRDDIH